MGGSLYWAARYTSILFHFNISLLRLQQNYYANLSLNHGNATPNIKCHTFSDIEDSRKRAKEKRDYKIKYIIYYIGLGELTFLAVK